MKLISLHLVILMVMINMVTLALSVMLSIAFYTLMERKMISLAQLRKGPNKTLAAGLLQPISDAIKLMAKETNLNSKSNFMLFIISPAANLACSLVSWMIYPLMFECTFMKMSTIFMISCMTFNTVSIMMMSWSSNSNYSYISLMRTISQLTSYEINFMLIMMTMMSTTSVLNFKDMATWQTYIPLIFMTMPTMLVWLITAMAETNRTPFDFSEGESELISGFNIEYSSSAFVLLFLSEYSSMLMMSMITIAMFMNNHPLNTEFYLSYIMISAAFIWSRMTLPRFRYDKLMKLNWTQVLPTTTAILYLSFITKMYCTMKS